MVAQTLKYEDIEKKISANIEKGFDLQGLRTDLEIELHQHEREILALKLELYNSPLWILKYRKFMRVILSDEIQAQNLREQISYIDKKITRLYYLGEG